MKKFWIVRIVRNVLAFYIKSGRDAEKLRKRDLGLYMEMHGYAPMNWFG